MSGRATTSVRRGLALACLLAVGAAQAQSDSGTPRYVPSRPLVANTTLRLTPNVNLSLETLLIGVAVYLFVDPLAPNWEGELRRDSEDTFSIALRAKRLRSTGGDGEAGRVFRRNAERIVREGGFDGYDVLAYSEGIESELLGAVRYAEGRIRVSRVAQPAVTVRPVSPP